MTKTPANSKLLRHKKEEDGKIHIVIQNIDQISNAYTKQNSVSYKHVPKNK